MARLPIKCDKYRDIPACTPNGTYKYTYKSGEVLPTVCTCIYEKSTLEYYFQMYVYERVALTMARLPMELDIALLSLVVNEDEGVDAVALQGPPVGGQALISQQPRQLHVHHTAFSKPHMILSKTT